MKRIPEATVQEILAKTTIVQVVGEFIKLERKGNRYWGLCPFHHEKTPSFSVDEEKNFFYCFGCQKGGNAVTFLMEAEKLSYVEALEHLAKQTGISIQYAQNETELKIDSHKTDLLDLYKRVAGTFTYFLHKSDEGNNAREYLKNRGLSTEIIEKFGLGWSPTDRYWLFNFLKRKGYSEEFLGQSGLFSKNYASISFFTARIMFPIKSARGEIVAFGGRTLGDGPKYLNSAESQIFHKSTILFALFEALPSIKETKTAVLCEGYMDAISLHQAGVKNAVAPLGTSFTEDQAKYLHRWAETVILFLDSDDAGQNAAKKSLVLCTKAGINVRVVIQETGKDPSEMLEKEGSEAIQALLANSFISEEYLVKRVQKIYNISTIEGKYRSAEWLYAYAEALDSEVKRQSYLEYCSRNLGIDVFAVTRDFERKKSAGQTINPEKVQNSLSITVDRELFLMIAVSANKEYFPTVRSSIKADDLENPAARILYIALEESFRNDEDNFDQFLSRISDQDLQTFVTKKALGDEFRLNVEKSITDGIRMVVINSLERKRDRLGAELRRANTDDIHATKSQDELMYEKMFIDSELKKLKETRE